MKITGLVLGCALVLGGGGAGWVYWHLDHNIHSVDIDKALGDNRPMRADQVAASPSASASPSAEPLEKGVLNVLVLGSDSRSGKENKKLGGGDSGGARSDTAMVLHLNADRTKATVVSIPRDTLVERPACPTESGGTTAVAYNVMFNSAYSLGGPVCAVKTVETMTGVRMDHYLEVDFAGFARLIDALGGVDVTTDEDIDDDLSQLHLKAGDHHLDGKTALAFARTRHGVGDGSDLGRIKLQQQLVKALVEQVAGSGLLTSPTRLYEIADAATGSLTTDTGLDSLTELAGLARSLQGLSADSVKTVMMPVVQAPSDHNRVVADQPEADELWESLR
ncbi:LCP family protein [Streptomyces sp. VRA16 Mangrove soil]|uniref:LCP family protein n=1 Tax=Streptomyces sp. VRA16 Mangrove soil TaxID=2817434 RepID=UPI0027DE9F6B|nr:LCP family protein [Streptomyces sp. VRA16 Mangrove soil]